jgi:caffeoyl-CoA O-methyltransferase
MQTMSPIIDPAAEAYAEEHTSALPSHLVTVDEETRRDFPAWYMMVGRQEGRFLELVVFASGASSILEIGTFTGFSSIAMAAGLVPGGRITTLEVDPHHAEVARANIAASPHADKIEVIEGPALASLERLAGPFDLVFIDADKPGYDAYFEAVIDKLSPRGIILADNTLYGGSVYDEARDEENAVALRRFNDKVLHDSRVVCVLTTIRDGVTLIRRAD